MTSGKTAKFVKRFGDVGAELRRAAMQYADEVASGTFPAEEHSFSGLIVRLLNPAYRRLIVVRLCELGFALRQKGVDSRATVGGFGALGDEAAFEFHLLLEAAGESRQHQGLDSAVGSACGAAAIWLAS